MYSRSEQIGNRLWEREARCFTTGVRSYRKRKKARTDPVALE